MMTQANLEAFRPDTKDQARWNRIDTLVWRVLADEAPHPRSELLALTNGAAINSAIARVRKKYDAWITCRRVPGEGETFYQYRGVAVGGSAAHEAKPSTNYFVAPSNESARSGVENGGPDA